MRIFSGLLARETSSDKNPSTLISELALLCSPLLLGEGNAPALHSSGLSQPALDSAALSPLYSNLLASWNWLSLLLWISHFAVVATLLGSDTRSLNVTPLRQLRRSVSISQCRSTCSAVSSPSSHLQLDVSKPGTRTLARKCARPILPVLAWTRTELSAFLRCSWSLSLFALGSSVAALLYQRLLCCP